MNSMKNFLLFAIFAVSCMPTVYADPNIRTLVVGNATSCIIQVSSQTGQVLATIKPTGPGVQKVKLSAPLLYSNK